MHIEIRDNEAFRIVWKVGSAVERTIDVPRRAEEVGAGATRATRYPDLAAFVMREWEAKQGSVPRNQVRAVLHCDNGTHFREMAGVMDAVLTPKRSFDGHAIPAFSVVLAQN